METPVTTDVRSSQARKCKRHRIEITSPQFDDQLRRAIDLVANDLSLPSHLKAAMGYLFEMKHDMNEVMRKNEQLLEENRIIKEKKSHDFGLGWDSNQYLCFPGTELFIPSSADTTLALAFKKENFRSKERSQLAKKTMMRKPKNDLPQAANMEKMAYSCPLEDDAFKRASNCTISTYPGTNLAVVNIANQNFQVNQENIREAVKSWWSVVEMNGPTSDVIFKQEYENMTIASFTQMAWAMNFHVGCGFSICSPAYLMVVCRYAPGGNIPGQPIYKQGPPCSDCPPVNATVAGTCSRPEGLCTSF